MGRDWFPGGKGTWGTSRRGPPGDFGTEAVEWTTVEGFCSGSDLIGELIPLVGI